MPSITLAQSALLSQDLLVTGIIEDIITVNPIFEVIPFDGIEGNALGYNRENVLGDMQAAQVGDTITAKNPATFTYVTSSLTTLVGDAEVNGLIQVTRSNKQDQTAIQIASKAKSIARTFQNYFVNGTGTAPQFSGILTLVDASQSAGAGISTGTAAANGTALTFADLDYLIDLVTDKDGQIDFLMMHSRTHRSLKNLLRTTAQGGLISEFLALPSGRQVLSYQNIPVFRNDWIPINQTVGSTTTCTSVIAGCWDDGSRSHGLVGLTAKDEAGIVVEDVGIHQSRDERIWRVKWYAGLANFSRRGVAVLTGVTN